MVAKLGRWSTYLVERFALPAFVPSAVLHTLFLLHYTAVGSHPAGSLRAAIGAATYLGVFLILRLSDEFKDKGHDDRYYPDRPVQRGLLSLRDIRRGLWVTVATVIALNLPIASWRTLGVLAAVGVYLALMRAEFFIPGLLRPRILLYLVTHQLFVPLFFTYYFALVGTWPNRAADAGFLLANLLLVMSLEVARKIRPRVLENPSRDTYSAALGRGWAGAFLLALVVGSGWLLVRLAVLPASALWLATVPAAALIVYYRTDRPWTGKAILGGLTAVVAAWMVWAL